LWLKPQFLSIFELILWALKPINFSSALLIFELFISLKNCSVSLCSLIAFEIRGFAKSCKNAGIRSSSFSFLSLFFNHISTINIERVFEYKKSSKVTAYEKRFVFILLQKHKDVANAQTNSKLVIEIKFCIFFGLLKKSNIWKSIIFKISKWRFLSFFIIIASCLKFLFFDFLKLSNSMIISGKFGMFCKYFAKFFIILSKNLLWNKDDYIKL